MRSTGAIASAASVSLQSDGELVAARPAGKVVRPRVLREQLPHPPEHGVAGRVALLEVELAEAIQVEERDAERPRVAVGARDVQLELGPEGAKPEEAAGQRVPVLELRQPRLELGDALPGSGELVRQAVPFLRAQVLIPIGAHAGTLESWSAHGAGSVGELLRHGGVLRET